MGSLAGMSGHDQSTDHDMGDNRPLRSVRCLTEKRIPEPYRSIVSNLSGICEEGYMPHLSSRTNDAFSIAMQVGIRKTQQLPAIRIDVNRFGIHPDQIDHYGRTHEAGLP